MSTLLLIRHGDNDYLVHNKLPGHYPNIHLNRNGRKQAAELEQGLKGLPLRAIFASPLERAVETAEPLARSLNLDLQLLPGLSDINVGTWTGRSWKVLNRTKNGKIIQHSPSQFQFPEGESFIQVHERVVSVLDSITVAHPDELVAVVFHADPIKLAVAHYLGLPLDHFQRLTISTGSVTILHVHAGNGQLLALNLVPPFSLPDLK